jgi:exodeoxyribonuclease VII small subunit
MKKSYKELQAELDRILDKFERSEHDDVDELLADYAKGKELIAELESMLGEAELTIKKAKKT